MSKDAPVSDGRTSELFSLEVGSYSRSRKLLVLAICCMSLLIVGLDNTIVNVALPSIGRDLHAPISGLQWTVDAYTLVLGSLLMLSGSMGDRLGRRRVFQTGLCLFTLGSLLCSLAPSLDGLIVFRMLQAIGGSMLNPVAMSIIRNVFVDPKERAVAIGLWGATMGVSLGLGPVVGGVLVQAVSWRAVFWINIPIGVAALLLTALFVPESKAARARRVDPLGQVLVILLLAAVTYAIIEGPSKGWLSPEIIGLFAASALFLAALVWQERRRFQPLLELRFFRSMPFSGATAIAVCAFAALGGYLFLNTLYLQETRGFSPLTAGLYVLPIAGMSVLCSPISGWIVGHRGPRVPLIVGGIGMMGSSWLLTGLSPDTSTGTLLLSYFVFGIGNGMVNAPITDTAIAGMPASQAGVAAAIASTSRQVGMVLGVAIIGALAAGGAASGVATHAFRPSDTGWWIVFGAGALTLIVGMLSTSKRARDTAEKVAMNLEDPSAEVAFEV